MKTPLITTKRHYWLNGEKLVCPHLRSWNSYWVALNRDPCPDCEMTGCHRKGLGFDEIDKLIIVKWNEKK